MKVNSEISNSGAEQSAGGSFASEEVTGSKLVGFSEGNDVEIVTFGNDWKAASTHGTPQRALNFAAKTAGRGDLTEQSSPRIGAVFKPSCPMIDCTFDDNTFCNYVTSVSEHDKGNGSLREWSIATGAVLNSLTGVPHDLTKTGSFIYAGGTTVAPEDTFILSTKLPVELKEAARLDFFVYQAADELQDNYAIGLDHIQLLNKYGMAAQPCNS
ncbi:hypothetical protein TELCIR_10776 [Teladorsagia circumcincta]|uniref:MAM domain-containing protein n=1 Tax=Teladorsagia circumcincta TaxID=45464 RepID=A0A2G9UBB0_TELCI|nr:hypothetical protein TELCIR_10776 [Teladorsagia circumcincta]